MKRTLRVEGEITEEGRLLVELPPDAPRGSVVLTLEVAVTEEGPTDEDLRGLGLTAEEIAASPEIGSWADATGIGSGASFVDELRNSGSRHRR